ncbi:MAG: hypothetical protein RL095_4009 [Verrucomicrobiota bacterium]|jgi:hypothetical protein
MTSDSKTRESIFEKSVDLVELSSGERDGDKVRYRIRIDGKSYECYFSCASLRLNADAEAAMCLTGLAAMSTVGAVRVSGEASPVFLKNLTRITEIFSSWFPRYHRVEYSAVSVRSQPRQGRRIGAFFTGGVDSFYTFLKHRDEITDLIFVHGYDVDLDDLPRRHSVSAMGRAIAKESGVNFLELETDAIRIFRDFGRWGQHAHGFGLASAARHLADEFQRIYIPSTFSHQDLVPWASHPDTDRLFGDETLELIHDGLEADRSAKVRAIVEDDLALRHLRVCWTRVEGHYNCGRCEKCLRTMTALQAFQALHRCSTFEKELQPQTILDLVIYDDSQRTFARDNLKLLESCGQNNSPQAQAWRKILSRSKAANIFRLSLKKITKKLKRLKKKLGH